mgnify:CR=1 FL=1
MAGTDRTALAITGGPVIVLVEPQLADNIGAAARAMLNFGLTEMRLVAPRDGWPNDRANAMASGAVEVLERAQVFETTAEAIADLHWVAATTARGRDLVKPVLGPDAATREAASRMSSGQKCGVLFGRERTGLESEDIARAHAIVTYPVNPAFASLNLAQAVLLYGYEWFRAAVDWTPHQMPAPAPVAEFEGFIGHLERELDAAGFLRPAEKKPGMMRNIRAMFQRADLTGQEVRTLRGVVRALAEFRPATKAHLIRNPGPIVDEEDGV